MPTLSSELFISFGCQRTGSKMNWKTCAKRKREVVDTAPNKSRQHENRRFKLVFFDRTLDAHNYMILKLYNNLKEPS